jgi:nitrogen regulatory protein PII
MKKVEAVFESFKLDQVREALAKEKIPRITIFEVKGAAVVKQEGSGEWSG